MAPVLTTRLTPSLLPVPPPLFSWLLAGVVVISHDFRLLSQIIDGDKGGEIWIVDHGINKWDGDIRSYKQHLRKTMA